MEKDNYKRKVKLQPTQTLLIGVILLILVGAFLLKLPICNNKPIKFIDSLFVATTSVCVTGLSTVVVAEQFTVIGQIVIMFLIQIGGLRINEFLGYVISGIGKKSKINRSNSIKRSFESR